MGPRALDNILQLSYPALHEFTLGKFTMDGLRQVVAIKSRAVLPYLVPQLTARPRPAPPAYTKIMLTLLTSLAASRGMPLELEKLGQCQPVVLSVEDE